MNKALAILAVLALIAGCGPESNQEVCFMKDGEMVCYEWDQRVCSENICRDMLCREYLDEQGRNVHECYDLCVQRVNGDDTWIECP